MDVCHQPLVISQHLQMRWVSFRSESLLPRKDQSRQSRPYMCQPMTLQIAYTNPETHKIILDNIQRSPLYGGMIEGVGPRYCPSIEDKVVRFAGKDRHPIFVEPCGENTEEMYLQGASSSLPEDVQNAFYRSIKGFEHIEILRPAYAIEYDCVDPTSLEATLESKVVRGLYGKRIVAVGCSTNTGRSSVI